MSGTELVHSAYVRDTSNEILRLKAELAAANEKVEELCSLLLEARDSWIKVGYGASYEDVAECKGFSDQITTAIAASKEKP